GQAAPAYMVYHGLRAVADAVPGPLQPPAEVYLLHMGKKARVETAGFMEAVRADEQRCACSPENILRIVVLPLVFFSCVQDTPPAEGVAQYIHPAAGRPRIFKLVAVMIGTQLGLAGGNPAVLLHL